MSFNSFEYKRHSQNGEDGLINHIFTEIGAKTRTFVEFGFGVTEANTIELLLGGWRGWWFDSNPAEATLAKVHYQNRLSLFVQCAALTRTNINDIFEKVGVPHEIDFLSIDVDGVDWHLWNALTWTKPRVVCIEYNADYGTEESITVPYCDGFNRFDYHPQYHGASLKALTILAEKKGMKLVGCDNSGHNAFYVNHEEPLPETSVRTAWRRNNRAQWRGLIERFREQYGFDQVVT